MTANNDFKALATGGSANVLSQADYAALTTLIANGFSSGLAQSAQVNKVLRQSTFVASAVAQLIVSHGVDALDDGDLSGFVTKLQGAIGASIRNKQLFTSSGTFTVPAGVTALKVTVVGGGGGGGANATLFSGGGGAGALSQKWITGLTPGATVAVTVGAAGAGGGTGTTSDGSNGGTSSFGAYCTCTGGRGGGGNPGSAGSGGTATGGDFNQGGSWGSTGASLLAGQGGGPGNGAGANTSGAGADATGYGGGGGGGAAGGAGGAGGAGYVLVEW